MSNKKRKIVLALGILAIMVMGVLFGCTSTSTPQGVMTALPMASMTLHPTTRVTTSVKTPSTATILPNSLARVSAFNHKNLH